MGLANPGETCGITGPALGEACQESADSVAGRNLNRTKPCLWSKPGLLVGNLDPLLTLIRLPLNLHFDSQIANISLYLGIISKSETNNIRIQFLPPGG